MKKLTHTGIFKNAIGITYNMNLRETKNYWINQHGTKFNKTYGHMAGDKCHMSCLVLSSIKLTEGAKQ